MLPVAAATCFPTPSGLTGWWPGEGNANDLAATNNGLFFGGANAAAVGVVSSAFAFDGTNSYIQFPDSPAFHPANLTIECWVRFTGLESAGSGGSPPGEQYIVFKQNSRTGNFEGFDLGKERSGASDFFRFAVSSSTGQAVDILSTTAIVTNTWYHVAGVRGSNFTQLYVNGQLQRQGTVTFAQDYGVLPLYFGSSGQSWDHKFKGTLDEVSLYNRALSSNEIAAIYTAGAAGKCGTPRLLSQPQNQSVIAGAIAGFAASASGTPPLSFQWRFSSTNLPGAASTNLIVTNTQPANAGVYDVVVTNVAGAVTSSPAVLTVHVPPGITLQPASTTNASGGTAVFSASAAGDSPLVYQWLFNGTTLPSGGRITGTASNTLSISNLQSGDSGNYRLWVTNSFGSVTSAVATLTVITPPLITDQPAGASLLAGASVGFTVAASGTPPFGYVWQRDGTNLVNDGNVAGASSSNLTIASVSTNDSAGYQVLVTNFIGAATSQVAILTVTTTPVPPIITVQPASQLAFVGSGASFRVTATGTAPLAYQWLKNGSPLSDGPSLSGASGSALNLLNLLPINTGDYQAVVTNGGGIATSSVATLTVTQSFTVRADALVLVNSSSAKFVDFQHFIQPYLDNFGVPYTVQNIATNPIGTNLSAYALIIIGHKQLDTNQTFLTPTAQAILSSVVSNGTGLVNFDSDLSVAGAPRYQFVQDIFGFTYTNAASATNFTFAVTEASNQLHYVTSRHLPTESIGLRANLAFAGIASGAATTNIVLSGGKPLVTVKKYGQGRALQWASYDWMTVLVLGPLEGMDDVIWRGFAWAARKPFVIRGMPNFVTMRVDDCGGPFWWAHMAADVGFKPFLAVFIADETPANTLDLKGLLTNGLATCGPHAFNNGKFIFFNGLVGNYSDTEVSNTFYSATQWHLTNGIPFPNIIATHYSGMGTNAFGPLIPWGSYYVPIEIVPGTIEYVAPYAPWLVGGPYRLYETPQQGQSNLPLYYADFLHVPGHPEMDGLFFNCYTEIRDAGACGEWCPDNNVASTVSRGYEMIKRGLDSMVLATVFTHDWYIQNTPSVPVRGGTPITTNNWRAIVQGLTNSLAPYKPIFVTLDYGNQYVRATRTSRLVSASFEPLSGALNATFSGKTDLATQIQIFTGVDNAISNVVGVVPVFSNGVTTTTATLNLPPSILIGPASSTNNAGTTATLWLQASGTAPLSYAWYRNGTNRLSDGPRITGSTTSALSIANLSGADTGALTVVVSNALGTITSSPPAQLVVIDPVITSQPLSRTNHAGTTATFSVGVIGTAPAYQWTKNASGIDQATNPSLILPALTTVDSGLYNVVISNPYGTLSSATASLIVADSLVIRSIAVSNGAAALSWRAIPGNNYTVQQKPSLADSLWTNLTPIVQATGSTAFATNSSLGVTQQFYRILLGPP